MVHQYEFCHTSPVVKRNSDQTRTLGYEVRHIVPILRVSRLIYFEQNSVRKRKNAHPFYDVSHPTSHPRPCYKVAPTTINSSTFSIENVNNSIIPAGQDSTLRAPPTPIEVPHREYAPAAILDGPASPPPSEPAVSSKKPGQSPSLQKKSRSSYSKNAKAYLLAHPGSPHQIIFVPPEICSAPTPELPTSSNVEFEAFKSTENHIRTDIPRFSADQLRRRARFGLFRWESLPLPWLTCRHCKSYCGKRVCAIERHAFRCEKNPQRLPEPLKRYPHESASSKPKRHRKRARGRKDFV